MTKALYESALSKSGNSDKESAQIRAFQIHQLCSSPSKGLTVSLLAAVTTTVVLWDGASLPGLVPWLICCIIVSIARLPASFDSGTQSR